MYLERKIDQFLREWKVSENKKPLIVKGARQIGKTESICKFGLTYKSCVVINFISSPAFKTITRDGYGADEITKNISLIDDKVRFVPGDTLIVFDEVQAFPDIATSLKFFSIDGRYDVICSGSLLGINYKMIESNSVGYKEDYIMHSMDFEEFLWAKDRKEVADEMLDNMCSQKPFSDTQMQVYSQLFNDYCVLGGMPAIVSSYIAKNSFEGVLQMQNQILLDYKEDVRKYASGIEQTRILNVFNHIPVQLSKDNKKFQISKVATGARFKDYWGCIEWLSDAGIINVCYCMNFPELPLRGNYDESKYKIYFADSGLLIASLDEESQEDLRANRNFGVYKGALYENIVAESLVKSGYELYYYKREDSTLEQDFFVRTKKSLVPIEVKANNGHAKSLKTLIESDKYGDISVGIKLANANIGVSKGIVTFPYFCAFLLKRYLKGVEY